MTTVEAALTAAEMAQLVVVLGRMRAQGRFALCQFLTACDHEMAGGIVLTSLPQGIVEGTYLVAGVTLAGTMREM
jgi:hypothetical protein